MWGKWIRRDSEKKRTEDGRTEGRDLMSAVYAKLRRAKEVGSRRTIRRLRRLHGLGERGKERGQMSKVGGREKMVTGYGFKGNPERGR